jgi:hypothetical protein
MAVQSTQVKVQSSGAQPTVSAAPQTEPHPASPAAAKLHRPSGSTRSSIMAVQSTQVKVQSSGAQPMSAAISRHSAIWKPLKSSGFSMSAQRTCRTMCRVCKGTAAEYTVVRMHGDVVLVSARVCLCRKLRMRVWDVLSPDMHPKSSSSRCGNCLLLLLLPEI